MRGFNLSRLHLFRQKRTGYAVCGLLVLALVRVSDGAESRITEPLAEIDGEAITAEELNKSLGAKLAKLEEQIYALKRQELDAIITQRLLAREAAKRGTTIAALLDAEVTAKVGLVTEKEIEDFFQANKNRLSGDEANFRPKIRAYLQQQKLTNRREAFVAMLRSQAKVVVRLEPPFAARIAIPLAGAPIRGPADASVTIVEFSDFECPFCKQAHPTLAQVLEKYRGKVRLVFRDFPLESIHAQALPAAEAARCARDQGKFWDYHDMLFAQSPKLSSNDLKRYAAQVGLDVVKFDGCLTSGVHKAAVQRDFEEGTRLGVTGTPAFFINGRPLQGAQPLETFSRMIDEELARVGNPAGNNR